MSSKLFGNLIGVLFGLFFGLPFISCAQEQAVTNTQIKKLKYCMEQGKKYEEMKANTEEESNANLQKAQDFYLCAEKEGDTNAGYRAAGLGESGVAKPLSEVEVVRLYTNAANEGHEQAAYELYLMACGNKLDTCEHPVEAKKWLLKAAELGKTSIFTHLGWHYLKGYDGYVDINRAAACFELAADKGDEYASRHLNDLVEAGHQLKPVSCL